MRHAISRDRKRAIEALGGLGPVSAELFVAEQARIVQVHDERVDVHEDALEVRVRAEGLGSLIGELRQQGERMAA